MATLREIIYDIKEHLNIYSDDQKLSEEHIAFMIHNKRNMLLKQYMSNLKKEIPQEAIQTLCMPLTLEDNCFDDISVLKSSVKIPGTLENTGRSNIINAYVGARFIKHLNIIDYSRLPLVASEKFNHTQLFVTVDPKNYLIVFNTIGKHKLLESIEIEGVFEDPEDAFDLSCEAANNSECDFFDTDYPIEAALIDPLKNQIIQELLVKYKVPQDNINDGEDIKINESRKK